MRPLRVLATLVALVVVVPAVAVDRADGARPRYRPPVSAPVADPFRPPPQPWMAGNRGIEYATEPGTIVRAIGPGSVSFAGTVAGRRIVTVAHPDGLRSSYVGLATVTVDRGDRVAGGDVVGRSTDRLHLGVRRGSTYLDPARLWGEPVGGGRPILVPDRPSGRGLGAGDQRRYTRTSARHPVGRCPSSHRSRQRSPLAHAGGAAERCSTKPLERRGP